MTHATVRLPAMALAAWLTTACLHVAPEPISLQATQDALLARSLADPGLRALLERHHGTPIDEWPLRRWDLDSLTLAAIYTQPSLAVARAHVDVAAAGVVTAAERPNPTLALSPEFSANPGLGISPWLAAFQIGWPIETAGKRERRIERAEVATEAARLAIPVDAWRVRLALRMAVTDFVAARAREATLEEELAQQRHRDALLAQRLEAGAVSQVDASLSRVARIAVEVDLADAHRQRLDARARIAAAIGVPESALAEVEIDFPLSPASDPLLELDEAQARRDALHERWDVRGALASHALSEATLQLELAKQYPDVHLGRGYQFDEGQNKWALALAFDVPILSRNEGPIAEAQASRREAGARILETQAQALAEIELALAHRRGAVEQDWQMQALVAEQRARLERARMAARLGAEGAIAVVDAAIELQRAERAHVDAQARVQQALAELEAAVQGPCAAIDHGFDTAAAPGGSP